MEYKTPICEVYNFPTDGTVLQASAAYIVCNKKCDYCSDVQCDADKLSGPCQNTECFVYHSIFECPYTHSICRQYENNVFAQIMSNQYAKQTYHNTESKSCLMGKDFSCSDNIIFNKTQGKTK